jgi:DNA-binding MarR family transcriptional regulator
VGDAAGRQEGAGFRAELEIEEGCGLDKPDLSALTAVAAINRTSRTIVDVLETRALRSFGITHAGFALMLRLWRRGPAEPRHLAARLHLHKSSIVSAADTLQRAGYLRRRRSTEDKRLVTLELTDEGCDLIRRAHAAVHRYQRAVTAYVSEEERAALVDALRRIEGVARTLLDDDSQA